MNWLKEFLDSDDLDFKEIVDTLTMSGTEVKSVIDYRKRFDNIYIGQVKEISAHPNADKLSLCKVDIGTAILSIVCGASNFKVSDKVPVASEGAVVGDLKIKRSKIRGEYSEGMMCSGKELGISSDADGIMLLSESSSIGNSFSQELGFDDVAIEIELTPNRPDCFSVIGIAREISALTTIGLKIPTYDLPKDFNEDDQFHIEIKDYSLCSRYSAMVFSDYQMKKTPDILRSRLIMCDVRPVDLIVDLTNYVMIECGQPLHAFDRDLLASDKIIVRNAGPNEKIKTIDANTRMLDEDMIVIADINEPVAIAGIMGGKDTEINDQTKSFLLESANFNGPSIMRTSKKLGLRSEASNRFEKKLDPLNTIFAIKRFANLFTGAAGTHKASTVYDGYLYPQRERIIDLRLSKVEQVLGQKIESKDISAILKGLGIQNEVKEEKVIATIPSFRYEDLEREIDLVEEIARIYGFERFAPEPLSVQSRVGGLSKKQKLLREIKNDLADFGLFEVINYTFISKSQIDDFKIKGESFIKLINPLNEDFEYLRPSLMPSMVKNMQTNSNHGNKDIAIFEVSKIFSSTASQEDFKESNMLAVLLSGKKDEKNWYGPERDFDFFDLKALLAFMIEKYCGLIYLKIEEKEHPFFNPAISADIYLKEECIGTIGMVHPVILNDMDIRQATFYFEIDLDKFIETCDKKKTFKKIPTYPSMEMDMAIVVDEEVSSGQIIEEIKKNADINLIAVRLFDIYRGKQIEEGKKSMAFSLVFQNTQRTLTDIEADLIFKKILEKLMKRFNAVIRK